MEYRFPFGQALKKVQQKDTSPKKVFVLGVYASAVHAKWKDVHGKEKVKALAVASEPEIFWKGNGAGAEISSIRIPAELGTLEPADKMFNGPSGNTLDELFLTPLGQTRNSVWLCDIIPNSRLNINQAKAIQTHYSKELIEQYNLPEATIPLFQESELDSEVRREEILSELESSQADILVLLGDLPIRWFLSPLTGGKYTSLSQFSNGSIEGSDGDSYGRMHPVQIQDKTYQVLPLCHPRQAGGLGISNQKWKQRHEHWAGTASKLV